MGLREQFEAMSPREQKLLSILGAVFAALVFLGLPIYVWTELSGSRDRNDDIRQLLGRMDRASELLAKRKSEREALERRYAKPAPALASFIESAAKANGLEVPDSTDQPDTKQKDYTERSTVVKMRKVGLKALVKMLERIEGSGHPVAITQLNIKSKTTPDEYDVKLAVSAYDKKLVAPKKEGDAKSPAKKGGKSPPNDGDADKKGREL